MVNKNHQKDDNGPSRRRVLKSASVSGAGLAAVPSLSALSDFQILGSAGATTNDSDDTLNRSLVIESVGKVEYDFSVTGLVSNVMGPSNSVEMGTVSASLDNEQHKYSFTGEFTSFEIKGDCNVYIDGEEFNYDRFPRNTLKIIAKNDVTYDVSASGLVQNEREAGGNSDSRRSTGSLAKNSETTLSYAGEITYVDIEGSAIVVNNGSKMDPDKPLPTIESGKASIRSFGTQQDYRLHLGWDAAVTSKQNPVDTINQGIVRGTATVNASTFSFNGVCKYIEIDGIGCIRNPAGSQLIECISESGEPTSFAISTTKNDSVEVNVGGGNSKSIKVDGEITSVVVESSIGSNREGVKIDVSPGATGYSANQAKKLQLSAILEREPWFNPLAAHAEARGGRIRADPKGITALHFLEVDPRNSSSKHSYIASEFEVADADGNDRTSIKIAKNMATGEIEGAQLQHHFRTDENEPQGVQVGKIVANGLTNNTNRWNEGIKQNDRISIETTPTDEIADEVRTEAELYERTELLSVKLDYREDTINAQNSLIPINPCDSNWVPCDDAREAYEEGASEVGKSADWLKDKSTDVVDAGEDSLDVVYDGAESGMTVVWNSASAVSDWGYKVGHFQGFSDRGAAAFNNTIKAGGPILTLATSLAPNGKITKCSGCTAISRAAMDYGVGSASMLLCTVTGALTAGVGGLTCSVFFTVLADLLTDHAEEVAAEKACEEAALC